VADEEHLRIIEQGLAAWNEWRQKNPELIPDPRGANLSEANLSRADLRDACLSATDLRGANLSGARLNGAELGGANLYKAKLSKTNLIGADLSRANLGMAELSMACLTMANLRQANLSLAKLSKAYLDRADLSEASLHGAYLHGANLRLANLERANLSGAKLSKACLDEANLEGALLVGTDLCGASLAQSKVYGASVWDITVNDQTKQQNLVITPYAEATERRNLVIIAGTPYAGTTITVDNIEVAQFVYLLLDNQAIRKVIDTITSKAVLILGRFSDDRKAVLDAIRNELRNHDYLPILFDFDPTTNQTINETVKTLAGMSRFVIADITDARSVPQGRRFLFRSQLTADASQAVRAAGVAIPPTLRELQ
jgi:Pentapeptide repeats (8 copies)